MQYGDITQLEYIYLHVRVKAAWKRYGSAAVRPRRSDAREAAGFPTLRRGFGMAQSGGIVLFASN